MRPTKSNLLRAASALGALSLMLTGSPALAAPLVAPFDGGDITRIKAAASSGDTGAMVRLGRIYETADGVDQDFAEARRLYGLAATKGGAEAMRRLGAMDAAGLGGPRSLTAARRWGAMAAARGDAIAMYRLATTEADPTAALDWYVKSAEAGCQEAMRELGDRYLKGKGIAEDHAAAARWYLKAALKGDAPSMEALQGLLETGDGAPKDEAAARAWSAKALDAKIATDIADAEAGESLAMFELGSDYFEGWDGAPTDAVKSAHWFRMAADHGHTPAAYFLGELYLGHGDAGAPRDTAKAIYWYRRAAAQGDRMSAHVLADLYESGDGVPADAVEAKLWRDRANALDAQVAAAKSRRAAALATAKDAETEPLDTLIADAPHEHPLAMMVLAHRLFEAGRKDEGVFWFYLGQLRWRAYLAADPDDSESQMFGQLFQTWAPTFSEYAGGDIAAMLRMFQAVLDWDAAHPDNFTPPGGARDQARQGLRALAAYTQAHADELRKQRASRGLPNK